MKRSFVITILLCILFPYNAWAQKFDTKKVQILQFQNQPLDEIIPRLEDLYRIKFSYSKNFINMDKRYTLDREEVTLEQCLQTLFKDSDVQFKLLDGRVVLYKTKKEERKNFTISGYILEQGSEEPLIGANLFIAASGVGTVTNQYGFFSLTLPEGNYELQSSYVGYSSKLTNINLSKDTKIELQLAQAQLSEVVVVASQSIMQEALQNTVQMSRFRPAIAQLKKVPTLAGEVDLLKTLTLTAGISDGAEGSTGLVVRGGSSDQNLILLDNARVYNASHLFGFLSVFNPEAVKSMEVFKGGFPARYGGRLSSVLDIAMKEGNRKKLTGELGIGIISSRFLLEGPLNKEKTSVFLAGRGSYLNILQGFQKGKFKRGETDAFTNYNLYDINAKINHKFDDKNQLFLSYYTGKDNFINKSRNGNSIFEERNLNWRNTTTTLRYNRMLSNKLFAKLILNYSQYSYHLETNNTTVGQQTRQSNFISDSKIMDVGLSVSFDFIPNPKHYIKFGAQTLQQQFKPARNIYQSGINEVKLPINEAMSTSANELALFLEDEIKWTKQLSTNIGIRLSGFLVQDEFYNALEPRLAMSYLLPNNWAIKTSYSFMQQYTHLLVNNSLSGLPNDIWVPATSEVPPQKAHQIGAGIAKTIDRYQVDFSIEGFFKRMSGLIDFIKDNNVVFGFQNGWENYVEAGGKGEAYGLEFFMHRKIGRLTGWAAYTLSWNNRQFKAVNGGETFPFKYDRRHDFSITSNYKFKENSKWDFSATWVFRSGHAVSLPVARYGSPAQSNSSDIFSYPNRNNYRMPVYHRLDIGASHTKEFKNGNKGVLSFSLYNAYNRLNATYLELYTTGQLNENNKIETSTQLLQKTWFLAIPSVGYTLKF